MNEKKDLEQLDQVFAAGDAWLRKYGVLDPNVNQVAHNNIILNLYTNFPKVRHVEYFMPRKIEDRWIKVVLHIPFWKLLFTKKDRMIDDVIELLKEYLYDYTITVELRRFKPSVLQRKLPNAP